VNRIYHLTLTTGHARWSPRSEVDPAILAQMAEAVAECERDGQVEIPTPDGLAVLHRIADSATPSRNVAVWALAPANEPSSRALVTFALAMKSRPGAGLWRTLHAMSWTPPLVTDPATPPPEPWLAGMLHLPALLQPSALSWLGDIERCVAWAWIDGVWKQ